MEPDPIRVSEIRRTLIQEVLNAAGLPYDWRGKRLLDAIFWLPTQRFAQRMAKFDADVAGEGVATAACRLLRGFVEKVLIWGAENIPTEGPVLLASNHPGAYDSFAVVSGLQRNDVRAVVSGVDFTHSLPATTRHLIYATPDLDVRMTALRQCLRHLHEGGLLFLFPTGLVDPDPALWPDQAYRWLQDWSRSLEFLLRRAPETRLVIAIASHVLVESCVRHPLTRLVRQDWQQRRLAEYIQVFQQLLLNRRFGLAPRVSYAPPCSVEALNPTNMQQSILDRAVEAMQTHLNRHSSDFIAPDDGST